MQSFWEILGLIPIFSDFKKRKDELKASYTGIITYDEDMNITLHGHRYVTHDGNYSYHFVEQHPYRKLFLEEQLQVARFGAMRAIKLKEKLINSHLA